MDRRDFLKTAGAASAALGLAACASDNKKKSVKATSGKMPTHVDGVSLLGYGCMRWPMTRDADGRQVIDQEKVDEMIDLALANGVNYFDSAPVYLQGQSEAATGKSLQRYPRDSYFIATKLSNIRPVPTYELSVQMYQNSLKYYGTDHIDYYLLHSVANKAAFDSRFGNNGVIDYLLEERRLGHIRKLGFSFHGHEEGFMEMMELHEKYHFDFCQIQMNYIDWDHASGRNCNASFQYEELTKRGIPVVIMEPLRGGALADLPAPLAATLKEVEPYKSLASWAFRFCGSFPNVMTALSGMTYIDHLRDNLDTFLDFKPLTDKEFALLENIAVSMEKYPVVGCTDCKYCMPCPYGIDIPGVFQFYNRRVSAGTYAQSKEQKDYERQRRRFLAAYDKTLESVRQADHCIACGECLDKCPQHLQIPTELRRIDQYIEKLKQDTL